MASHSDTTTGIAPLPGAATLPLGTVAATVDKDAAARLASSLRKRPGHVVVTAPFATTAARLFELAESQLGAVRIVHLSARVLLEPEILRALAGRQGRGSAAPSPAAVAAVIEEARAKNRSIVILVEDADALEATRLERACEVVERTAALRDVVRLALLGSGRLLHTLEAPEAGAFLRRVTLHLNVSAPDVARRGKESPAETARPMRRARSNRWLSNEQLLVLAVGVVLVTGVLLFPVKPTEYPKRPPAATATPRPSAADAAATVPSPVPGGAAERASGAPTRAPAADLPPAARFAPPARPGPAFQVGAFRDQQNATALAARLARDFGGVYIDQLGEGSASLYRVRVAIPGLLAESGLARELRAREYSIVRVE